MNKKTINIVLIVLFVVFLVLAIIFNSRTRNAKELSLKDLNEFSNTNNVGKSYVYIDYVSEDNEGYAIVFDNSNPYVVYLDQKSVDEIKKYDYKRRNIKLVGLCTEITDEIKNKILTIYNKNTVVGDEEYLKTEDFNSVFGNYYLNVSKIVDDSTLYKIPSFLTKLFFDLSLVSLLILGFKLILERRK